MIVRELPDGRVLTVLQENHADLSAQFAAHWGNSTFARLDPFETLVFATTYHDSGHREVDVEVPFDLENCRPYGHRNTPPERRNPEALAANNQWLCRRDVYSGLLVSMHHAGLRKRRYDTIESWQTGGQGQAGSHDTFAGMGRAFDDLEGWQTDAARTLGLADRSARRAFWSNYCMLQVFDLLSLYFCLDGYEGERMVEAALIGIPLTYQGDAVVDLHIAPTKDGQVRMDPYPFDAATLRAVVPARVLTPVPYASEAQGREAFFTAPRKTLEWEIVA